jgi:hypothetical protein
VAEDGTGADESLVYILLSAIGAAKYGKDLTKCLGLARVVAV